IEVVESLAAREGSEPGMLLLRRSGLLDRNVLVLLDIKGTAARGTDYAAVSSRISLLQGEATAALEITPLADAILKGGGKYVDVTVKSDPSYRVGASSTARIWLVEEKLTLDKWRLRELPTVPGDLAQVARGDFGQRGVQNFNRYAYGLNA